MRAAMISEQRFIGLTDVDIPAAENGEVIIKVKAAGVNGYDLAMWQLGNVMTGAIPGHEVVGTVEHPGNSSFNVGDRVTVIPLAACMECDLCKAGKHNSCFKNKLIPGKCKDKPGCFAEYIEARPEFVRKVPDKMSDFEALMLAPAATAYHMVKSMDVQKGWRVLISGGGIMGALVAMWCKYFGAKYIGVIEVNRTRAFNLMNYDETDCIFDANETHLIEELILQGKGFNVQFECSGNAVNISNGILAIRRNCTIATISMYTKSSPVNLYLMGQKNIDLRTFSGHTISDFDTVMDLVQNNKKINLKRYYSKTIKLEDLQNIFKELETPEHKYEKVIIEM